MAGHILSRFNYLIGSLNIRIKCFDLFLGMAGHILSSVLRAEQMYHCFEDLAVTNCFFFKIADTGLWGWCRWISQVPFNCNAMNYYLCHFFPLYTLGTKKESPNTLLLATLNILVLKKYKWFVIICTLLFMSLILKLYHKLSRRFFLCNSFTSVSTLG